MATQIYIVYNTVAYTKLMDTHFYVVYLILS